MQCLSGFELYSRWVPLDDISLYSASFSCRAANLKPMYRRNEKEKEKHI